MSHWLKRSCPLCSSDEIVEGSEVKAPLEADAMTFSKVAEFWRGFRKDSCFFTFSRCAGCGLLYCRNYFTNEQLISLYASMGDNSAGVADSVLERTQRGYYQFLNKFGYLKNGRYLELGPDRGLLSKNFANFGASKMTLIEPNHDVRDQLRGSTIKCPSVEILNDRSDIAPGSLFDVITGIHVYDHLVNLREELATLSRLSISDSRILIVVHDESSLLRRLINKKWPPFCLQHPQLFNPSTIEKALLQAGFKEIEIAKSTNWFPIAHIAHMACSLFGIRGTWTSGLPKIEIPLRLGNMIIVAKKA